VQVAYPDFRKCLNSLQQHVVDNRLELPEQDNSEAGDYKIEMVQLFKQGKIREARELLCGRVRPEEIEEIYTYMYRNLDLFGKTPEAKDQALLIIKQGLLDHTIIADPEINLAATLVKLANIN
jgi:hypothetical protein